MPQVLPSLPTQGVLYWEFFNDTIFSINRKGELQPKYFVNFQEYAIPAHVRRNNNVLDIMNYYVGSPQNSKIASLIKYIHEDSSYLRFVFMQKEQIICYVKYNNDTKRTTLYRFVDYSHKFLPTLFIQYKDGEIIIAANIIDTDENPVLFFINEEVMM
jgi:hypothetical protein